MNEAEILSKIHELPLVKQQEVIDFIDFLYQKEKLQVNQSFKKRAAGQFEGQIKILPGFDDPIEGMEEYYQ